jgi:hypothetical protein
MPDRPLHLRGLRVRRPQRGHSGWHTRGLLAWAIVGSAAITFSGPSFASAALRAGAKATSNPIGPVLPGTDCPSFPDDAVWNTPITTLPVDPDSATWLAAMDASTTNLHPDYGPSGNKKIPYGIPWTIVTPSTPLTPIKFQYASQSDKGPYPFTSTTPIEGGQHAGGDRHAIMVNSSTCVLYELWHAHYHATGSTAGSGAIWTLTSDALRKAGWTSADAAGLPILPLLVNFDQVKTGAMDHAIRVTAECTQESYLWPARHEAGQADTNCPPMGARFRLDASFSLPANECAAFCQTLITTMKNYGLIVADNGSNWFFQGSMDTRWTYQQVDQLKQIPASAFEAVDESCMQVSATSAQAYQPGTAAYTAHCG